MSLYQITYVGKSRRTVQKHSTLCINSAKNSALILSACTQYKWMHAYVELFPAGLSRARSSCDLDSNLTMVLYKSFTYLLTYLLTYLGYETRVPGLPYGEMCTIL